VVSQCTVPPGICFESSLHLNGKVLFSFRIIPDRGFVVEVQFDTNDCLLYLDRRKRRRKFLATTFLRALGYGTDADIINLFYTVEKLKLSENLEEEEIATKVLISGCARWRNHRGARFRAADQGTIRQILTLGVKDVQVVDSSWTTRSSGAEERPGARRGRGLKDIYRRLRPGDPTQPCRMRALAQAPVLRPEEIRSRRVGRYKRINQKLESMGWT